MILNLQVILGVIFGNLFWYKYFVILKFYFYFLDWNVVLSYGG